MPKLSKEFIESIENPLKGQCFYRDDDLTGFAIRVTSKSKSYILEKRVGGANLRVTIGNCRDMTIEAARKQTLIMLGDIAKGNDPKTGKRINTRADITLREVFEKFLELKQLRAQTKRNYFYAVNAHLEDWLNLPITSITNDMVEQRHHDLTIKPNRLGTSGHLRATNTLKMLRRLCNFANNHYSIDGEPLIKNDPFSRMSSDRIWHRAHPREGIIPDHKLKDWYRGVCKLLHSVARDFLIFILFTGMRFGETRQLKWSYVDFKEKLITVPRELTKTDRQHLLPLSDFLVDLLQKRHLVYGHSEWVFQSATLKNMPLSQSAGIVCSVRASTGIHFTVHDLRRTFSTMGAKKNVPDHVISRLLNHSVSNNMTSRYLVLDVETLRLHMSTISQAFIDLMEISNEETEWKNLDIEETTEVTQLQIPLEPPSEP